MPFIVMPVAAWKRFWISGIDVVLPRHHHDRTAGLRGRPVDVEKVDSAANRQCGSGGTADEVAPRQARLGVADSCSIRRLCRVRQFAIL